MVEAFPSIKKCPHCNKYSNWNNNFQDLCQHCNNALDPVAQKEENEYLQEVELHKDESKVFWVTIRPIDNFLVIFGKRIIHMAQIIFMAIVSFVLWVTAAVAG